MGHIRLGWVPKTQRWDAVVANILDAPVDPSSPTPPTLLTADVAAIAKQALEAAEAGLDRAINDTGLRHTVYVLTQIVLAARESDWQQRLSQVGIELSPNAGVLDLT